MDYSSSEEDEVKEIIEEPTEQDLINQYYKSSKKFKFFSPVIFLKLKGGKFKPFKLLGYKENEFQIILLYSHDPLLKKNMLY